MEQLLVWSRNGVSWRKFREVGGDEDRVNRPRATLCIQAFFETLVAAQSLNTAIRLPPTSDAIVSCNLWLESVTDAHHISDALCRVQATPRLRLTSACPLSRYGSLCLLAFLLFKSDAPRLHLIQ